MRLDKFLQLSRLIKRRTQAKVACEAGCLFVNDRPAKAGMNLSEGDIVEIRFSARTLRVKVIEIPAKQIKKATAKDCYEVESDITTGSEAIKAVKPQSQEEVWPEFSD